MGKTKQLIKKYSRQLSQVTLLCFFILVITCFMPREKKTIIDFKEGAPWKHEQLIADFSFDVPKPDNAIDAEKDSILARVLPHFKYAPAAADTVCARLATILSNDTLFSSYQELPDSYTGKLKSIYSKGIISDKDAKFIRANGYSAMECDNGTKKCSDLTSCSEAIKTIAALNGGLAGNIALDEIIKPNYSFDSLRTAIMTEQELAKIVPTLTSVQQGQKIIGEGDVVDYTKYHTISTYLDEAKKLESAKSRINRGKILLGQILFVIIAMFLAYAYLELYQPEVVHNAYKFIFCILSASVFPVIVGIMLAFENSNIFMLPFAIVPMMLCLFVNNQSAIVIHTITILMCSTMLSGQYEFVLLQIAAGYSMILSLKELSSRSQMFRCVLIAFATYSLVYLCYTAITSTSKMNINYDMYIQFAISSLLTLIAYPIMVVIEKIFHFVSNVTLIELSNLNAQLLQKLSQEAPGTFQHSIQVSNLAAEAARAVGANSLLVRTGALYHDIGKSENPIYFTENQSGGISPHTGLSYIESAQIIKKHVTDGLEIAKHAGLPKNIQEFITTHHGASKTGWFYISYKNEHPGEEIDEELFTYPGPKPTTKEQAILMLADSTEAASHSIGIYTEENINKTVDNVVDGKLNSGELSLSPLTFQDIETIKNTFKRRLMAIYHTRISYPKENKETTEKNEEQQSSVK